MQSEMKIFLSTDTPMEATVSRGVARIAIGGRIRTRGTETFCEPLVEIAGHRRDILRMLDEARVALEQKGAA